MTTITLDAVIRRNISAETVRETIAAFPFLEGGEVTPNPRSLENNVIELDTIVPDMGAIHVSHDLVDNTLRMVFTGDPTNDSVGTGFCRTMMSFVHAQLELMFARADIDYRYSE